MSKINASIFPDVADAIGLPSPAFVEKDYYVVQLLKQISSFEFPTHQLIFSGGTCLAKAHADTFRMSEDLDFKAIPTKALLSLSLSKQRVERKAFRKALVEHIGNIECFQVKNNVISLNEGRYQEISIIYPKNYKNQVLRPEIKLEITEDFYPGGLLPIDASVGSLCSLALQEGREISSILCDPINLIASEKLIALLRKTAECARNNENTGLINIL